MISRPAKLQRDTHFCLMSIGKVTLVLSKCETAEVLDTCFGSVKYCLHFLISFLKRKMAPYEALKVKIENLMSEINTKNAEKSLET